MFKLGDQVVVLKATPEGLDLEGKYQGLNRQGLHKVLVNEVILNLTLDRIVSSEEYYINLNKNIDRPTYVMGLKVGGSNGNS